MKNLKAKWVEFLDGWGYFLLAWDCYTDSTGLSRQDFWETLSTGWMDMYIYPYDDPYHPKLSNQRILRLGK